MSSPHTGCDILTFQMTLHLQSHLISTWQQSNADDDEKAGEKKADELFHSELQFYQLLKTEVGVISSAIRLNGGSFLILTSLFLSFLQRDSCFFPSCFHHHLPTSACYQWHAHIPLCILKSKINSESCEDVGKSNLNEQLGLITEIHGCQSDSCFNTEFDTVDEERDKSGGLNEVTTWLHRPVCLGIHGEDAGGLHHHEAPTPTPPPIKWRFMAWLGDILGHKSLVWGRQLWLVISCRQQHFFLPHLHLMCLYQASCHRQSWGGNTRRRRRRRHGNSRRIFQINTGNLIILRLSPWSKDQFNNFTVELRSFFFFLTVAVRGNLNLCYCRVESRLIWKVCTSQLSNYYS